MRKALTLIGYALLFGGGGCALLVCVCHVYWTGPVPALLLGYGGLACGLGLAILPEVSR